MAEYFQIPEVGTKVRPGSYFNVDKNGDDDSFGAIDGDRKSTRLNSSHITRSRMPSSA